MEVGLLYSSLHFATIIPIPLKHHLYSCIAKCYALIRATTFEDVATNIDFVLDLLVNSLKVMKEGGTIVSLASPQLFIDEVQKLGDTKNVKISALLVQSNGDDMNTLKGLPANRTLKANVSKNLPFSEMRKAR